MHSRSTYRLKRCSTELPLRVGLIHSTLTYQVFLHLHDCMLHILTLPLTEGSALFGMQCFLAAQVSKFAEVFP